MLFRSITGQALHLNYILNRHEVFFKQSWLPAFIYLIIATQFKDFVEFSPLLVVNTLFILFLDKIFALYKNQKTIGITFDAALLISIIALIYAPALLFLLLFFISVAILKSITWRDLSIGIVGMLVPFSLVIVGYFMSGNLLLFLNQYKSTFSNGFIFSNFKLNNYLIAISIILFVLLLAVMKLRRNYLKNVTKSRLCQQIILLFILLGTFTIPLISKVAFQDYFIFIIPVSSVIAYYFLDGKKIIYQELLMWLLISNWIYTHLFIS